MATEWDRRKIAARVGEAHARAGFCCNMYGIGWRRKEPGAAYPTPDRLGDT